jgi:3-phenylpropionate/trans-cinnamate dioxygenase ferredoxin subunit
VSETSTFVRACALADLAENSAIGVEIGDLPVALVRTGGEVFALYDVCSH